LVLGAQLAVHPKVVRSRYAYGRIVVFSFLMLENACVHEEWRLSAHQENKEKERRKRIDIDLYARGFVSNDVFTVCKNSWAYAALKITRYNPSTVNSACCTTRVRISPQ